MKLINCKIQNFGKLHNVNCDFNAGCNTWLKENGWGKSTLAAFIKVMFYGFDNESKRNDYDNERKRYKPWQGGIYGGQITFEVNNRLYTVVRIFGDKEKEDTFSLRDAKTNLESTDYSSKLGEEIFNLDSGSFKRSIYTAQNDCDTAICGNIELRLRSDKDRDVCYDTVKNEEESDYEKAAAFIKAELDRLTPNRKTGELSRLKEKADKYKNDIKNIELIDKEIEKCRNMTDKMKECFSYSLELEAKQREADIYSFDLQEEQLYGYYEKIFEYSYPAYDEIREKTEQIIKLQGYKDRIYEFSQSGKITKENTGEQSRKILKEKKKVRRRITQVKGGVLTGTVFMLAGIISTFLKLFNPFNAVILIIGAVIVLAGIFMMLYFKEKIKDIEDNEAESGDLRKSHFKTVQSGRVYDEISNDMYEEYRGVSMQIQSMEEEINEFLGRYYENYESCDEALQYMRKLEKDLRTFEKLSEKKSRYNDAKNQLVRCEENIKKFIDKLICIEKESGGEYEALFLNLKDDFGKKTSADKLIAANTALNTYESRINQLLEEKETLNGKKYELDNILKMYEKESKRYSLLKQTGEFLEIARQSYLSKYMQPFKSSFDKYYAIMTGLSDNNYNMDADMNLSINEYGILHDRRFLSAGNKDLVGICIRMALLEAMFVKEKPFIILDDVFVNLDSDRLELAKKFIRELEKEYQIIYFTCYLGRVI